MDYEKKYKDALEKAKEVYNRKDATDGGKLILESMFPELKESEDERIRKKVIDVLKFNVKGAESQMQASRGVDRTFEIYACNKVIAWLEKQGGQKPAWGEEDEKNFEGIIREIEANKYDAPDYDIATYNRFLSWLKSIKERVQL